MLLGGGGIWGHFHENHANRNRIYHGLLRQAFIAGMRGLADPATVRLLGGAASRAIGLDPRDPVATASNLIAQRRESDLDNEMTRFFDENYRQPINPPPAEETPDQYPKIWGDKSIRYIQKTFSGTLENTVTLTDIINSTPKGTSNPSYRSSNEITNLEWEANIYFNNVSTDPQVVHCCVVYDHYNGAPAYTAPTGTDIWYAGIISVPLATNSQRFEILLDDIITLSEMHLDKSQQLVRYKLHMNSPAIFRNGTTFDDYRDFAKGAITLWIGCNSTPTVQYSGVSTFAFLDA